MPRKLGPAATTLVVLATVVAGLVLALAPAPFPYRENMTTARPVASRVKFSIEDQQQTLEQRLSVRASAPNYYRLNGALLEAVRGSLTGILTLAKAHGDDRPKLIEEGRQGGIEFDDESAAEMMKLLERNDGREFLTAVDRTIAFLQQAPLVEPYRTEVRRTASEAILLEGPKDKESERRVPTSSLIFASDPDGLNRLFDDAVRGFSPAMRRVVRATLVRSLRPKTGELVAQALYRYDSDRSNDAARAAAEAVKQQYRTFDVGAMLADAGPIVPSELELLRTEQKEFEIAARNAGGRDYWLARMSRGALGCCAVLGWWLYLLCTDRKFARNPLRLSVALLLVAVGLSGAIVHAMFYDLPYGLLAGSQAFAAGLLGLLTTLGAGLATAGLASILTMLLMHDAVAGLISLLVVSLAMVVGARDIRFRGRMVMVGGLAAAGVALTMFAAQMIQGQTAGYALFEAAWAAGATLFAAFVVEGTVPLVERVFGVATNMTLLEWCDANKPLLRTMAAEAPGTYNHSLMVGTLAEAAANAIGANGLLVRAGAYYHDIGKINKPEYFVENQMAGISRHDRLSPAMSLLIIIGHIKDGIEMAREYRVPSILHPFILEHHGTTLVEYFYHAANKARRHGDQEVSESEYRYPGPKPQSRETAVLMLCDGVEGAVRAMTEPTPTRIESVVGDMVRKRLLDGQFDECELTFRELATIEKSLIKALCGIYHARIAYPEREAERDSGTRRVS